MIKVTDILDKLNSSNYFGDRSIKVTDVIQLDPENTRDDVIYWCSDKNAEALRNCRHGVVICTDKSKSMIENSTLSVIVVENPRAAFATVVHSFFTPKARTPQICKTAIIHPSVKLGTDVYIGENVVIEENVEIGDNTTILHGTVILHGTKIGSRVKIGMNNSIGGDGLGYVKGQNDLYEFIPHIGNVIIHDQVETGSACAVDRAALGHTIIGFNTKLDNFIHVAHGVKIGKNCILTASVMIAGSTTVGDNVWIGPSSALMNKIKIGDNAFIGLGSVVIKDVLENTVVAGNPARVLKRKE